VILKEIKMNNDIQPPFKVDVTESFEIKNEYTGASVTLDPLQTAVYDKVKGAEQLLNQPLSDEIIATLPMTRDELIDIVNKGKEWFAHHYPDISFLLD